MTFFEHQRLARRNTRVMVVLYLISVVAVVLASTVALVFIGVPPVWGAIGILAAILSVSLYKMRQLAEGGTVVAEMVGARPIAPDTRDPLERRLLNVIEEMAIASGVRVPKAYVMDEERGINAFAAGYDVSNAVVAVTRGTLETLSRDELQGVIGHEFSHILNGDMWLNIKMIGVLSGIVFIGAIGNFLMRSVRHRYSGRNASGGMFLAGLALFVIGYVGLFFARLIKAAVSRQREFLADASSVQFTRNPDGIAGALDQIRASSRGALIANRYAEDMSHMYFGQGISVWMSGLFDTHPPLDERIARVRPGFQRASYRQNRVAAQAPAGIGTEFGAVSGFAGGAAPLAADGQRASDAGHAWGRSASESVKLVGTLDAGKVDFAARLIARLPPELRAAMNEPEGACAVMIATLLAPKDAVLAMQLAALRSLGFDALAARAQAVMPLVRKLGRAFDLTVVDLALPAIKAAADEQKRQLVPALEAVIHADRRVSMHEFVALTLVKTQLAPRPKPGAVKTKPLSALRDEIVLLMSLVAYAGGKPGADPALDRDVADAFNAGAVVAGLAGAQLLPKDGFSLASAGTALENLMAAAPLAKAILVKALFAVVSADATIRLTEAELMRLIGAVLDCPLPPLIEDIDPATLAA